MNVYEHPQGFSFKKPLLRDIIWVLWKYTCNDDKDDNSSKQSSSWSLQRQRTRIAKQIKLILMLLDSHLPLPLLFLRLMPNTKEIIYFLLTSVESDMSERQESLWCCCVVTGWFHHNILSSTFVRGNFLFTVLRSSIFRLRPQYCQGRTMESDAEKSPMN